MNKHTQSEIDKLHLIKIGRDRGRFGYLHKMLYFNWLANSSVVDLESKYPLARAVEKLYERNTVGFDEMEWLDSQFDASEWSGPAWERIYKDIWDRTINTVSESYHVPSDIVLDEYNKLKSEQYGWH